MRSRLLVPCLLCALLGFLRPSAARAWTEAHVRAAHVTLALRAPGRLEVAVDLALEVRGGWLERLELPGLDDGLELAAEQPALAVLESGERIPAQVSKQGSTLVLKFARRDGLRRGSHHLLLHYAVEHLPYVETGDRDVARLYWTLPGFEAGLGQASIELRGAQALRAVAAPEVAQDVASRLVGSERVLTFSRLHVPRASPWTIAVDLPRAQLAGAQRTAPGPRAEAPARFAGFATSAALTLAGLGLLALMRLHVARALRREGLTARGLWLRRPLSGLACAVLGLGGGCLWFVPSLSIACWAAMFVFGVPQAHVRRRPLALGSFRALTRAELRAAKRARLISRAGVPFADLSSWFGSLGAFLLLGSVAAWQGASAFGREPWSCLALVALLGFVVSARSLRPRSFAEQVGALEGAVKRARTVACAFGLVAYASHGRVSQPRLRIMPSARYPGLLRLEALVDTRRSARPLLLSALVEADSAAERWLSEHWPHAWREYGEGGRRIALLCPVDDLGQAAEALLEHLSRESQRLLFAQKDGARAA
jgi:hypothetical protein